MVVHDVWGIHSHVGNQIGQLLQVLLEFGTNVAGWFGASISEGADTPCRSVSRAPTSLSGSRSHVGASTKCAIDVITTCGLARVIGAEERIRRSD
jgi:hypothetical protein